MAAISTRTPKVGVEYDCHGQRVVKVFDKPHEARQFWIAKLKAGKNPQVKKVE